MRRNTGRANHLHICLTNRLTLRTLIKNVDERGGFHLHSFLEWYNTHMFIYSGFLNLMLNLSLVSKYKLLVIS